MLRVTTIHARSAGASARYYTRYLTKDGPEADGVWAGRQAGGLGLSGVVSTEELELLLSGHDPITGTRLGTALVDRVDAKTGRVIPAVAGFDATFSAPKDVSVLWALSGDDGFAEAHDVAVTAVLAHLERFGATTRVRTKHGRQFPDTAGLTMAAFRQATSREDDPQLHTHVVISTKVQTADGRWLALDARYLKRKQHALGHLYQAVLRAELTHRYEFAWGPVVNGQAGILGMPQDLLEVFSKRTAQIDEALAEKVVDFQERNGRDPNRWERAALTRESAADTRETKTGEAVADLGTRWRDEADALGWNAQRLNAALCIAARDAPVAALVTVAQVLEELSAGGSTWTRAEVLRAVSDLAAPVSHIGGRDWARAIETACDRVLESCITLDPPNDSPVRSSDGRSIWIAPVETHLTHEAILAEEERVLTFAIDAQHASSEPSATVNRDGLDVLQADVAAAVAGRDELVLVVGPAGTGKTTTLRRAADDLRRQHRTVFGVAPTAKAAKVLRDETGIPADTVAKLLHEWRPTAPRPPRDDYRLPAGSTLIVDEAGMLGTGNLDQLTQLAVSQQWRLVLVGDPRQLQAVGRGGMFDELCRAARVNELATIHRFRHRWEQTASLDLRRGDVAVIDAYIDHGRVDTGTFDNLAPHIATEWIAHSSDGRTVAVVAETNDHVDQLNAAIQARRRALGHLGRSSTRVAGSETVAAGDVIVTRRNDRTLLTDRGEPVRNRDLWQVDTVRHDGSLTVTHNRGHGQVTLPADYVRSHVRLGYAATAHGHQGETVDVGFAVITAATSHRSLYVAATRGREENRLLVVAEDPTEAAAREVLEQAMLNDRADVPAVAQRRHLGATIPGTERRPIAASVVALQELRKAANQARAGAAPYQSAVADAEGDVIEAQRVLRDLQRELHEAAPWRRRRLRDSVERDATLLAEARARLDDRRAAAAPFQADLDTAERRVGRAEIDARRARLDLTAPHREMQPRAAEIEADYGVDIGF